MPSGSVTDSHGNTFDAYVKGGKIRLTSVNVPASSGGTTPFHRVLTATNNAVVVRNVPCQLYSLWGVNSSVSGKAFHVKLYNKTTTPNPATDTPLAVFTFAADVAPPLWPFDVGLEFTTG